MKNDLCVRNHGVLRTILSKKMGESYFGDIVFEAFLWFCAVVLRLFWGFQALVER